MLYYELIVHGAQGVLGFRSVEGVVTIQNTCVAGGISWYRRKSPSQRGGVDCFIDDASMHLIRSA